jgi:hypothetical protein
MSPRSTSGKGEETSRTSLVLQGRQGKSKMVSQMAAPVIAKRVRIVSITYSSLRFSPLLRECATGIFSNQSLEPCMYRDFNIMRFTCILKLKALYEELILH